MKKTYNFNPFHIIKDKTYPLPFRISLIGFGCLFLFVIIFKIYLLIK